MRLWTLHPRYLDSKGLVALWREALLAQAVLRGLTRGYRHHPQLHRFRASPNPSGAIAAYLEAVHEESERRGFRFDKKKIARPRSRSRIAETRGQLMHEWEHLRRKLERRDPEAFERCQMIDSPLPHPLFRIVTGPVRHWEKSS